MSDPPIQITFHRQRTSTARIRDGKIQLRISSYGTQQHHHINELIKKMTQSWARHRGKTSLDILDYLKSGELALSTGSTYMVSFKQTTRKSIGFEIIGSKLFVLTPSYKSIESHKSEFRQKAWKFLAKQQHPFLINRLNTIRHNWITEEFHHLTLKMTHSRWGSCDRKSKTIMLCLKLLLVTPELLDYVCIHELAHLRYSNHGKDFWELVSQKIPDYKEKRKVLNHHE